MREADRKVVYTACFWNSDLNAHHQSLTGVGTENGPESIMGRSASEMQIQSTYTLMPGGILWVKPQMVPKISGK